MFDLLLAISFKPKSPSSLFVLIIILQARNIKFMVQLLLLVGRAMEPIALWLTGPVFR